MKKKYCAYCGKPKERSNSDKNHEQAVELLRRVVTESDLLLLQAQNFSSERVICHLSDTLLQEINDHINAQTP